MSQKKSSRRHSLQDALVLSLFPGIDLLGWAFEEAGFCVVRGPDLMTGGDNRDFHPPKGRFNGVIGGPPCQDFSTLNRNPGKYGEQMTTDYCRVIEETDSDWFLYENVVSAPPFEISGYYQQRFALDLSWFSDFSRRRDFVFGSKSGELINPAIDVRKDIKGTCVTGSDERSFSACCEIQGLSSDFDLPFFSLEGKKQAVANGVPMQLGRHVAGLIASTLYGEHVTDYTGALSRKRCKCGCGRAVVGRAFYASASCRKRAQRARDKAHQ